MKKLQVFCGPEEYQPKQAWDILGEYAMLYGDNGGDSDGPVYLPSNQDDIPANLAREVVSAGLGEMVDVIMATDEAMINYLLQVDDSLIGLRTKLANDEFTVEDADRLQMASNEAGLRWSHFGAYGAGDSHWVFIKEEE